MIHNKLAFALLVVVVVAVKAKPSHPFGFHGVPDHLDFVPPVLPAAHFHSAPFLPAPAHLLPAPAPLVPAAASLLPAPAPLLPAPAPLLPAPVVHAHAHVIPAASPILPPVLEPIPFAEPLPSYRAIPGPKTTTHHVSIGYAFPHSRLAKFHGHVHAVPHAHLHAAPLAFAPHHHHHHHLHQQPHTLF